MALINWLTELLHYLKRHWSLLTKNWRALSARKDRMKKEQVKEKSHDKEIHTQGCHHSLGQGALVPPLFVDMIT